MITHLSKKNKPQIIDISKKEITKRTATAQGSIIFSKKTFKKYQWPVVDVTRKSVEETAASIIKIYEIKKNG